MQNTAETKPFFSVIIPVYRVESFIEDTLRIVQQQKFADFECIMMDDGSPDSSALLCGKFAAEDSRFHLFHKENGGASSARNAAVKHASGAYLAFLDGDDWWDAEYLESMHKLIQEFPDCSVYSSGRILYYCKKLQRTCLPFSGLPAGKSVKIHAVHEFASAGELPFWTGSTVVPKNLFSGFPESLKMFEDHALWIKLANAGPAALLNEAHAYYRLNVSTGVKPRGELPDIQTHLLSALGMFEEQAGKSPDLKLLLDRFRLKHLLLYVDHPAYKDEARRILAETQPQSWTLKDKLFYSIYPLRYFYSSYKFMRKRIKNVLAGTEKAANPQGTV